MRRKRALILTLLATLAAAPAAYADTFQQIFRDYKKDGKIDGCKYSAKQLADAKHQIPTDIEQYAPDFPAALARAMQKRTAGRCATKSAAEAATAATGTGPTATAGQPPPTTAATDPVATTGVPPANATPPAAAGATPAPTPAPKPAAPVADQAIHAATRTGSSDAGVPAPLIAVAIVAGLMLIAGLVYALVRWWAWEPRWLVRTRHASAEAGWRASNSWAEFLDWVRLGR